MRWGRAALVASLATALLACGGGGGKTAATGSSSPGSVLSAASGDSAATASDGGAAPGTDGQAAAGGDAAPGDGGGGGGTPTPDAVAPAPPGAKPFAGKYTFQVTGQGDPHQIVITIDDVSDTDQRMTTPPSGPSGEQVEVLRFLADRIDLVSLEMKGPFAKTFNGPVMFAPVPADVGASWSWDLTSTDKLTHVHQASRVDRTESVTIGGQTIDTFVVETDITISGDVNATGHLTSWASPVYKLAVRNHSVLHVTTPVQVTSDTTSELLDLRPS